MKTIHALYYALCIMLIPALLPAQNAPGTDWKMIKTPQAKLVFPAYADSSGREVAATLNQIYDAETYSMPGDVKRIPLLLFNQAAYSNGYVALMPRRSVWYNTPPQDHQSLGSGVWYDLLALHEYRHVVQYDKVNQNLTRLAYYLFGDNGRFISHIGFPLWFWEGDAILAETLLSGQGRGRIPSFTNTYRLWALGNKNYSYPKAYFGSYKDYIPSHYPLGYVMVSKIRRDHGAKKFNDAINWTTNCAYWPYAFSMGLKRKTGKNAPDIYRQAFIELDSLWAQAAVGLPRITGKPINRAPRKGWARYRFPQQAADGRIIALKSGLASTRQLVAIDPETGAEEKLTGANTSYFHTNGKQLVFAVHRFDARWDERSYYEIWKYSLATGKTHRLTHRTRYYAPALSPDGQTVAAISYNKANGSALVLLDAQTGQVRKRVANLPGLHQRRPRWSPDGNSLWMTFTTRNGAGALHYHTQKNETEVAIQPGHENIGNLWPSEDYVFYESNYTGVDAIFALDIQAGERFLVWEARNGVYGPSVSRGEQRLLYTRDTRKGANIHSIALDSLLRKPLGEVKKRQVHYFAPLQQEEKQFRIDRSKMRPDTFHVSDYKPWRNAFRLHSWGPYAASETELEVLARSTNSLLTLNAEAGIRYDVNENTAAVFASAAYSGRFPVLSLEGSYGLRSDNASDARWQEQRIGANLEIPLFSSYNQWNYGLSLATKFDYRQISELPDDYDANYLNNGELLPMRHELMAYWEKSKSKRDLAPPLGLEGQASYAHTPFDDGYNAEYMHLVGKVSLPGLFKHHSLSLRMDYEQQNMGDYLFTSYLPFVRGYDYYRLADWSQVQVDYKFPLLYPDWAVENWFYLKRIQSGLFYDHGVTLLDGGYWERSSGGMSVSLDFHFLHLPVELNLGLQAAYLIEEEKIRIGGMAFGVSFY